MFLDANLTFDTAAAITTTRVSTNVIDLLANRDLGVGRVQVKLVCLVTTAFTSATPTATLNVQLQGAPDNGSGSPGGYATILESGVTPLGQLLTGTKIAQFDFGVVSDAISAIATVTATYSSASTAVTAANNSGINGYEVTGPGIVPGTTIASGGGTTSLTLSQNTTAASTTGPGGIATLTFSGNLPPPRFVQLNYVASATMTAGAVSAYLALDVDEVNYYKPGIIVNN